MGHVELSFAPYMHQQRAFDGAQSTDLVCLIRRLGDKLQLQDSLACFGTSATIWW